MSSLVVEESGRILLYLGFRLEQNSISDNKKYDRNTSNGSRDEIASSDEVFRTQLRLPSTWSVHCSSIMS